MIKKTLFIILYLALVAGCSAMQKQADGRYFDIATNNNSEASIWLEKIIIDDDWLAPGTGAMGCGSSNINGGGGVSSPSYDSIAPQDSVYLEWYSWKEKARMKAKIIMPESAITNKLLINPPWSGTSKGKKHRSKIIIDFRYKHKVWIKLAKSANPKSQDEVMILAEGQGIKTRDIVTRYDDFKEGKSYTLDCVSKRQRLKELGYYTAPLIVYDDWYLGSPQSKEEKNEQ